MYRLAKHCKAKWQSKGGSIGGFCSLFYLTQAEAEGRRQEAGGRRQKYVLSC
ncbi:MAG: hypothetical protein KME27_24935 [Lyngbya sp. HA4199-MV5]|nr:hypothetical protein [Lyngbya sp. HA4199-MV5]